MDRGDRRIRSLKIHSHDATLLGKAQSCLEGAFRTASLPGLPPNAQLLVRRLDLGSIRVDQNPVVLAGRITELMRNLAVSAICVDWQSAANAEVVWFSDLLQPCKVLLLRLLDGKGVQEWYWRTLFSHHPLGLNTATLGMIFSRAAATPLKGLGPARLLGWALEPHRLARLFPCITEALVRRLLQEQGVAPGVGIGAAPHSGGQGELRSGITPPDLRQPWRHAIGQAVRDWGEQDVRTLWLAWNALINHHPSWLERKEILPRIQPGGWLKFWGRKRSRAAAGNKTAGGAGAAIDSTGAGSGARRSWAQPPMVAARPAATVGAADIVPELLETAAGTPAIVPSMPAPVAEIDTGGAGLPQRVEGFHSALAGLALVIPVLERLGMAHLLACHEQLVALDLPRQLLWSLAMRFGMAEFDPLRQLFSGFELSLDGTIAPFHAPTGWRRLVTTSGRPLNAPDRVENQEAIALHQLINTLQLLVALYLRRYCRCSLRTLLMRPGRVVVSATHWDVIFDLNQIDLRLRRIALDSDPGWVAWLGWVVQFHYDREGERYV